MIKNTIEQTQITLSRPLINQLLTHAQNGNGDEVCGFISSLNGKPVKIYPISNIATLANQRFEMEPQAQINAIKNIREQNEEIFSIYHSHPSSSAMPSQADIDEFSYPEALSLIISLSTKGVLEIRAYRMMSDHALELAIKVE